MIVKRLKCQLDQKYRNVQFRMIKIKNLETVNDQQSLTSQIIRVMVNEQQIGPHISFKNFNSFKRNLSGKRGQGTNNECFSNLSIVSNKCLFMESVNIEKNHATNGINQTTRSEKRNMRENHPQLKQIITQQKIKVIVRNFIKKLTRNNIYSTSVDYTPFFNQKQLSFLDTQGIQLHDYVTATLFILSTVLIVILSIIYTLSLVFEEVNKSPIEKIISPISLVFYIFELGLNLITVKFEEGKRLGTLRQIWSFCSKNTLATDAISILLIFVDYFIDHEIVIILRLFVILKLGQGFEKIEKLEVFFIHNFYYEQYWSLVKVFLFNFSLAHVLAIFLVAMAGVSEDDNWMNYKNIHSAFWYEKYAWAYYWATTMMLTVGFGDLTATNYKEAIILTLIEMISCIALSYNINCVGTLISNIRSQDLEKGKNFKVFYKLSRKNDLSEDLEWRINNYIEESSNIKKKFNYEEQSIFVQKLPKGLKTEFLKESHKKIFQNLPFFKNLMERTLFNFAQRIQMHICHPEQIIQHLDDPHNLLILKGGEIGFTCRKPGCDYNSTVVDQLKIRNISEPILVSLGFVRSPRSIYEIKSLQYSILYFLDYENILSILKGSEMDYELYCLLRDKSLNMPDDFELFNCEICKQKHTKFTCPKLHFIPIKQHVANKYLHKFRNKKCLRDNLFTRYESTLFSALKIYLDYNKLQSKKSKILKYKKEETKQVNDFIMRKNFQHIEDGPSNTLIKEISQIKDFFSKNTAQLIKHEMNKAFQYGEGQDDVWIIETDKMKNYKSYFEADNSCNLMEKFCLSKRPGVEVKPEDYWEQIKSKKLVSSTNKKFNSNFTKSSENFSFKTFGTSSQRKIKEELTEF